MKKIFEIEAQEETKKEGLIRIEVREERKKYTIYLIHYNSKNEIAEEWFGTYNDEGFAIDYATKESKNYKFYDRERIYLENLKRALK